MGGRLASASGRGALALEEVLEDGAEVDHRLTQVLRVRIAVALHHRAPVPVALDDVWMIDGDERESMLDVVVRRISALLEHALDDALGSARTRSSSCSCSTSLRRRSAVPVPVSATARSYSRPNRS